MLRSLKHTMRLLGLGFTLARHDALFVFEAAGMSPLYLAPYQLVRKRSALRKGVRLANALQAMGPSFIKLGQALSTRPDLIGDELAEGLTVLQDRMPPFASAIARATIEEQLGAALEALYTSFDDTPVAAASIAQVHFATSRDGRDVAVKVLRPRIEERFNHDIDLFTWLAEMIEWRLPSYRRLKPVEVVATFTATIRIELDLRMEAAAAEELRANSKDDADFYVPAIDWPRTARRVLTLERIDGIAISDIEGLKAAGINLDATMEKAARAFFNQVFRDGFFHADMHPGNLFVLKDGRLAPVDFGIMGRIDHKNQLILAQILWGFFSGDYMKVAQVHHDAGWIPPHVSVDAFAQAVRAVGTPIMGKALNEISVGRLLGQLISIAQNFEMEAQPQLLLLQKTMVTAEGVGRMLNPSINMWKLAEPLIKKWADEHLSAPARIKMFAREAVDILKDAPRVLREMKEFLEEKRNHPMQVECLDHKEVYYRQAVRIGWVIAALLSALLALEIQRYM